MTPGRVALTVGTTAALRIVKPDPVDEVPWGLWCYRVDGWRCLPEGALSEGGNVLDCVHRMLRLPDPLDLGAALARAEPDGHGLTVLLFLAGERSCGWKGGAKAAVPGIRPEFPDPDSWTSGPG